jgi:hypothetical protein
MLLQFSEIFLIMKYNMTWDDVSYLHVQRIEINDLVFLKLIFLMEKCDVGWGDFLDFLELFFDTKKEMWDEVIFLNF